MKRTLCIVLCLLLLLPGCSVKKDPESAVLFYYCRKEYQYGRQDGVVAPEQREVSEHTSDLKSLLALYLIGPLDEELTSPFIGAKLIRTDAQEDVLTVELTDNGSSMTDAQFSLACACMAMTCLQLSDVQQVSIICGSRTATMSADSLLLYDSITPIETITEETQ